MISLKPSDDQQAIVDMVAGFVRDEMPVARLRDADARGDAILWPRLGALGVFALTLPEASGGAGCGVAEEVLAFRELGRGLASPAAVASSLSATLSLGVGRPDLAEAFVTGGVRVGLAIPVGAAAGVRLIECRDVEWMLLWGNTSIALVHGAGLRGVVEVPCIDGAVHFAHGDLAVDGALVRTEDTLRPTLLVAALLCGAAEEAMRLNVEYLKVREQFGQPLGAFQSVKHRCADMAKRAAAAWSQTCLAALMLQADAPDARFQTCAAKILATDAGIENAEAAIQNFGAIGFTADHPIHHYLKRAHLLDMLGGNAAWQRRQFMAEPNPLAAA